MKNKNDHTPDKEVNFNKSNKFEYLKNLDTVNTTM